MVACAACGGSGVRHCWPNAEETDHPECMNACARCSVHDDGSRVDRCKRSFRSTQRSIRGGPTERRPSVRPSDRECQSCSSSGASQLCQPAKLVSSSPLFSLLVCFAEGCQAIENVILPTHSSIAGDYEQYIWTTQQRMPLSRSRSTTKGNERAPGGTTAFVDRDKHTQGQIDT